MAACHLIRDPEANTTVVIILAQGLGLPLLNHTEAEVMGGGPVPVWRGPPGGAPGQAYGRSTVGGKLQSLGVRTQGTQQGTAAAQNELICVHVGNIPRKHPKYLRAPSRTKWNHINRNFHRSMSLLADIGPPVPSKSLSA